MLWYVSTGCGCTHLATTAQSKMADDDSHIYKVPRPVRSHSFTTHSPTPSLPICMPTPHAGQTIYTQNQVYAVRLPLIPSSAPPALPPRNSVSNSLPSGWNSESASPTFQLLPQLPVPLQEPGSRGGSPKRQTADSSKMLLPRFGSFKEKSTKVGMKSLLGQAKRRFSEDTASSSTQHLSVAGRLSEGDNSCTPSPLPGMCLTLGKLTDKYVHSFPFQVKAMQSYSFQASQLTIVDSDFYNLYFIKQQQFVSMQDSLGSYYTIPLNSAVQFGYINQSDRKSNPHTLGYKSYNKVADLLALSELEMPKVICAQQPYKGQSGKCSLEENEVLAILQIRKSKLSGRKYLKVYSFKTKSKKSLYHDCLGHFTTNPAHLRLWLTDMASVSASIFPCQAVIYLEKRFTSALKSFPSTLLQADSFVTLVELKTQNSIIASLVAPQSGQNAVSHSTLLDIPVNGLLSNLQVEVQTPHNSDILHEETRRIYEGLDITSLQSLDDGITDRAYDTKCLFYTILRKGSEQVGVTLLVPRAAYQNRAPELIAATHNNTEAPTDLEHESDSDNEHYEKLSDWVDAVQHNMAPAFPMCSTDTPSVSSPSPCLSSGYHSHDTTPHRPHLSDNPLSSDTSGTTATHTEEDYELMELPKLRGHYYVPPMQSDGFGLDVPNLRRTVKLLEDRIVPLEKKVAEHQQLQALVRSLSARIVKLEKQLMPHQRQPSSTTAHSHSASIQNISHLRSLDTSQVRV